MEGIPAGMLFHCYVTMEGTSCILYDKSSVDPQKPNDSYQLQFYKKYFKYVAMFRFFYCVCLRLTSAIYYTCSKTLCQHDISLVLAICFSVRPEFQLISMKVVYFHLVLQVNYKTLCYLMININMLQKPQTEAEVETGVISENQLTQIDQSQL